MLKFRELFAGVKGYASYINNLFGFD